jgi:hypothetical protein
MENKKAFIYEIINSEGEKYYGSLKNSKFEAELKRIKKIKSKKGVDDSSTIQVLEEVMYNDPAQLKVRVKQLINKGFCLNLQNHQKDLIKCKCKGMYLVKNKARHCKSQKHRDYQKSYFFELNPDMKKMYYEMIYCEKSILRVLGELNLKEALLKREVF